MARGKDEQIGLTENRSTAQLSGGESANGQSFRGGREGCHSDKKKNFIEFHQRNEIVCGKVEGGKACFMDCQQCGVVNHQRSNRSLCLACRTTGKLHFSDILKNTGYQKGTSIKYVRTEGGGGGFKLPYFADK